MAFENNFSKSTDNISRPFGMFLDAYDNLVNYLKSANEIWKRNDPKSYAECFLEAPYEKEIRYDENEVAFFKYIKERGNLAVDSNFNKLCRVQPKRYYFDDIITAMENFKFDFYINASEDFEIFVMDKASTEFSSEGFYISKVSTDNYFKVYFNNNYLFGFKPFHHHSETHLYFYPMFIENGYEELDSKSIKSFYNKLKRCLIGAMAGDHKINQDRIFRSNLANNLKGNYEILGTNGNNYIQLILRESSLILEPISNGFNIRSHATSKNYSNFNEICYFPDYEGIERGYNVNDGFIYSHLKDIGCEYKQVLDEEDLMLYSLLNDGRKPLLHSLMKPEEDLD